MSCNIFSWGANSHGQLGLGFQSEQCTSPQKLNISNTGINPGEIIKITGGAGHTIILDIEGNCFSCGWNHRGQLGLSTTEDNHSFQKINIPDDEKIIDAACGWDSSIALSIKGNIFCWGSNLYGQLGIDSKKTQFHEAFKVSLVNNVNKIAMGLRHTAVVTKDGFLYVTGAGNNGQLGLVDSNNLPIKQLNTFTKVPELKDIIDVSCGQYFTIVMTNKWDLFGFGNNKYQQLIFDNNLYPKIYRPMKLELFPLPNSKNIICGWTHCILLTGDKRVISWGRNTYGELGRGKNAIPQPEFIHSLRNVKQISVGSEHNVAITSNDTSLTWGWNEHGNCGNGDVEDIFIPSQINLSSSHLKITGSGAGHSFAVIEDR